MAKKKKKQFAALSRIIGPEAFGYTPDVSGGYAPAARPATPQPRGRFELGGLLGDILNPTVIRPAKTLFTTASALGALGLQRFAPGVSQQIARRLEQDFPESPVVRAAGGKTAAERLRIAGPEVARNVAGVASLTVPFGRGAGLLQKAILPGAAVGGLFETARPGATPTSVAAQAGLGGLTAGAFGALGKVFGFGGAKAGAKIISKVAGKPSRLQPVGEKMATQLLRSTGADYQKALQGGVDIRKAFVKYPFRGNFEKILAQADDFIRTAEKPIQALVSKSGKEKLGQKAYQKAISSLRTQQKTLSQGLQTNKAKALGTFIKEVEGKFGKTGEKATLRNTLNFVRNANKEFGIKILEEEKGAATTQGRKLLANSFRQAIKSKYPKIAEGLDVQHDILSLRPIIEKARSLASTEEIFPTGLSSLVGAGVFGGAGALLGGVTGAATALGGFTAARAALRNPRMLSALARIGAPQAPQLIQRVTPQAAPRAARQLSPLLTNILGQTGARAPSLAPSLFRGGGATPGLQQPQQTGLPQTQAELLAPGFGETGLGGQQAQAGLSAQGFGQRQQVSANPYPIENFVKDVTRDPRNFNIYKYVFEQYKKVFGGEPLQLSDTAIKNVTDLESGIVDIKNLYTRIQGSGVVGPIRGLQALSPYATEARSVQAEIDRVKQTVGKALEGGVLRKEDEEKYKKILPTIRDNKDVALNKLTQLYSKLNLDLNNYYNRQQQFGKGRGALENIVGGQTEEQNPLFDYLYGGGY